jgi:peptidoglycan/xylan/chitin deacetylase (PgdA/CDA1 family)
MIIYPYANRQINKIALTFDDGPNPPNTLKVLDILESYGLKGNFFVLGKWVKKHPGTVLEMIKRGHLIGNHGYAHLENEPDFETCDQILFKITGEHPIFGRPPYCYLSSLKYASQSLLVQQNKLKLVTFDVDPDDNHLPGSNVILERILKSTQNGSIIDLHDSSEKEEELMLRPLQMIAILPQVIEELLKNFQIVRLDEMELQPLKIEINPDV